MLGRPGSARLPPMPVRVVLYSHLTSSSIELNIMELVYIYIGMSVFALIGIIALAVDSHGTGRHKTTNINQ